MKAKLSYKSKINIVIAIIILILFAASATTTYFFVKGNQDSSAFTENDSQTGENTVMQESTQGEQNNQKENDEVVIPNVNDNNSENTTTKAEGNRPSTQIGQNGVKGNGTATTTQTTGNVPNQEYVTERTEQETVLASENYAVAWSPLKIQANTTTKGCSIIRPEITAAKTVSENAVEGEKITYTITVANNGNEAGIAIVKDTIPEGTTFVERSIKVNKGETEYTAEDLANGIEINVQKNTEVSVEFEVIVNEDTVGTISNIAKVNEEDTNATKSIVVDTIKPVVFLNGVDGDKDYAEETIEENKTATYEDKGARGTDNVDGDFTIKKATKIVFVDVDKTETEVKKVNMGKAGEYILEYTYTDAAGNTATATRIVRVADTTAPEGTIEKSNNDKPTNKDVTVTLTTNEPVDCPEGWTEVEGSNGQKYTKIYEDNKEDTVTIVDKAGNKTVVNFEVKGIDKVAPEGTIEKSNNDKPTNKDVTVTLTTNEPVDCPEGWTEVEGSNGQKYTKIYEDNKEDTVTIVDKAGNKTVVNFEVKGIDKVAPEGTIEKSNNDKPTNKDVTVTLTTNEPVDCPEGWTEVEGSNGQKYTKIYEDNKEDTVTIVDKAGNKTVVNFEVKGIDKVAPEGTIEKSNNDKPTNKDVTVTLTTNEPVDCPEGWTEVEGSNGQKYTKIYEDNKEDTVTIVDKAGNKTVVNFEVKGIDKVAPEINIAQNVTIIQWDEFVEDIYDNISDTCTAKEDLDVKIEGTVDTSIAKTYTLTYTVTDEAGNSSTKTRTVEVKLRKVMFADGPTFNSKIKTLTNNIKTIERVDTEPTTNNYIEVQTEDSNKPIKMWVDKADNTKILWYTKAPNPKLSSDLSHMFSGLSSLTSQDITNVCDTSNITNMNSMFEGCTNLITLDISNFNTSKVTDMNSVFSGCSSLTTLNVSKWDTSKVTNMGSMFNGCSNLTTLDVSNFNTGEVTNMNSMFNGCSNLTTLDVSNFNTGKVTDMNSVFSGCSSLTTLNVSKWDTSKVTNMDSMFNGCSELTTLDVSEFNTSNVTSMASMFNNCENLTMLNVSNWDTSNVTSMSNMFKNCTNLTTVYASDSYVTNQVKTSEDMFTGCLNIKGGNGTTYDTSHIDKEYARIDTPRTPGYFTPITPYVMFESGSTFNTKIKKLYNDNIATIERPDTEEPLPQDNIVTIERASVEPTTEKYIELQTVDSTNFIKMWVDKNDYTKILWYTKAEKPQLNSDSSYMFNNLNNLKSQDITNICDTSKVTNMTQMFYRM